MLKPLKQDRQSPIWWLLAAGIAAALKCYFSAADYEALSWMLRPLSLTLHWLTGWQFQRAPAGEWISADAGIVLVKACAGINFMTMSFIGWCVLLQPSEAQRGAPMAWLAWVVWPARLASALALAWLTAVAVNALRVIAVVAWQPALEHWLAPAGAHRLIGLVIYLAALTLQLMLGQPRRRARAAVLGSAVYVGVMIVVPLVTGNAAANAVAFREHALAVLAIALPLGVAGITVRLLRVQ